jgi:hypothetical protein
VKKKERKWIEWMARFGLAGRGFVYLLVAFIAIQVPFGKPTSADKEGALATLSARPWGKPILLAIAIGFAGYAVWRLVEAILDPEGKSRKSSGKWKRVGYLARGLLYTVFAYNALKIAITAQTQGSTQKAQTATAGVLGLPFGKWAVIGFGLCLMVAGAYNAYRFVSGRYRKDMKEGEMSPTQRRALVPIAAIGLGARAIVFVLIGFFFVNSGVTFDPGKAVGLDGALRRIAGSPGGPLLLAAVAGGLAAFGVFSLAQARFREVMNS